MTDTDPDADAPSSAGKVRPEDDGDDCPLTDQQLLNVLKAERGRSIGFNHDADLQSLRERSLEYYKGEMADVPTLPNRSRAVDSTLADTVDTLIPDLVEIFTGGDDVVTFRPRGPEDEDAAEQETDYLNHVVFQDNGGWLAFATAMKDALLCKLGVFAWWWENKPEDGWESFKGQTRGQVAAILQSQGGAQQLVGAGRVRATPSEETGEEPLYDIEVRQEGPDGRIRIAAWAPEDFTVAADTVELGETTYCAARSRPRAQKLKADGFDAELVDRLPACARINDETAQARDTADESMTQHGGEASKDMRQVEVVDHFIRIPGEDAQLELWRVRTGGDETVLLSKERVERVQYAAMTPDIACHRLYGRGLFELLGELQRIKTALTRGWLDSIYFANNPRYYVDMTKLHESTLDDVLNNVPMQPVRGMGEGAVTALSTPQTNAGIYAEGLEYFSVATEHRTGVMRNAQGLNPDTLHDTAKGAQILMTAAQKRTRMIARIFAETGVKDMYLGVHALIREHGSKAQIVRLRGGWTQIDPTSWGERNDMTIELGLGSGGREQDIATLTKVIEMQQGAATTPGAQMLVTPQNAYNALTDLVSKMGSKKGQTYFTDPSTVPPQPQQPHPEVQKAMIEAQTEQAKMAAKSQAEAAATQQDGAIKAAAAQHDAELKTAVAAGQLQIKREQFAAETQQREAELETNARIAVLQAGLNHHAKMNAPATRYGGEPG